MENKPGASKLIMSVADFKALQRQSKPSKEKTHLLIMLQQVCKDRGLTLVEEYRFHDTRRWRFDYCIPERKIAIEYEGLFSQKSRHTTITGFSRDCEKYNAATLLGWRVLRYTAATYKKAPADLVEALRR
jgi:very-short-patch-repair endonuclease